MACGHIGFEMGLVTDARCRRGQPGWLQRPFPVSPSSCSVAGQDRPWPKDDLGGNAQRTRHIFNKAFLEALAEDFRKGGRQAIEKVRKNQPAAYMKICALFDPQGDAGRAQGRR